MINVAFASSNEYVPFLSIALTSFLEHNEEDFDFFNIFILDNEISEENKNKILDLTKNYSCKITFIELKVFETLDIELPPITLKSTVSLMTYARLFISSVLPNDIKKLLYLDCDALILGSFKELWDTDLEDYYCAGVLDPGANETLKESFWFYDVESYINGGVLLINLEKWRQDKVEDKFIDFISKHQGEYFVVDQGVLNNVFNTKIKVVEPKYNLLVFFQYCDYDTAKKLCGIKSEYYNKKIVDESRENPVFVHFAGNGYLLPWHNKNHKYSSEFEKYAKKTNSQEVIDYIDAPTLKFKLFYSNRFFKLLKFIPTKMFVSYINKRQLNGITYFVNNAKQQDE